MDLKGFVLMGNTDIINILLMAQVRHQEYMAKFMSDNQTSEYYGRGQLEGLAAGMWTLWRQLGIDVHETFSKEFRAYMEVWGEQWGLGQDHDLCEEDTPEEGAAAG